jgi:hypothetical protein
LFAKYLVGARMWTVYQKKTPLIAGNNLTLYLNKKMRHAFFPHANQNFPPPLCSKKAKNAV